MELEELINGAGGSFGDMLKAAQEQADKDGAAAGAMLQLIDAKLDKVLAFDALLVELLAPIFPKKVAAVVVPQLRKVLE